MISFILVFFLCLGCISVKSIQTELVAEFKSQNASGYVIFKESGKTVNISLMGSIPSGSNLTIHYFPVKYQGPMNEICKTQIIGGIFYDLPGKFNGFRAVNVSHITLSGQKSIFGRSLAIRDNSNNIIACATIKHKSSSTKTVVGVFQAVSPGIAGTIVLRQAVNSPQSVTAVDINLMLVDARSEPLNGLSLAVYKSASTSNDEGSCEGIEELFNPLGKTSCDKWRHSTCPIGDLSAKLGPLGVPLPAGKGKPRKFYIDTNLPLSGKNSVAGRSLVILSNGQPLICTKIKEYQQMASEVAFDGDMGLTGMIGFTQESMYEPVMINVSLTGHDEIDVYEHLHVSPGSSCSITQLPLAVIKESGPVDELTMYGARSVMFGTLAVKKGSSQNAYCIQLKAKNPTYHLQALARFNETSGNGLTGSINFEQVSFNQSKAFASSTSIVMSLFYKNNRSKTTKSHNWHVHISPVGDDPVGKKCMSCLGHYNPYNVYVLGNDYESTCILSNPFRCELGDLSNKLGTYDIGGGSKRFTETENYFASWHNIIGRSVVIHVKDEGAARLACADIKPQNGSSKYNMETLNVKNTSKTRDQENFRKVVSAALNIQSWRVADVKYEQMKTGKDCMTYKFLLIDDSMSNLHRSFADLVEDNPEKLKEFVPSCGGQPPKWKIEEGNSAEIIGVVFGIIILLLLVFVFIFWLRRRRKDYEESSKLVQNVDAGAATSETTVTAENNDNPPSEPKQDWKVTTTL